MYIKYVPGLFHATFVHAVLINCFAVFSVSRYRGKDCGATPKLFPEGSGTNDV